MNCYIAILIIGNILFSLGLMVVARLSEKILSPYWKILYLIPGGFLICIISLYGYNEILLPACIGAAVTVAGFVIEKKNVRYILCSLCMVLTVTSGILCMVIKNYGHKYAENFENAFNVIRENYILADYKDIDFDKLYEEYYPMFEEADKNNDPVLNTITWARFAAEFHDGHVGYMCDNPDVTEEAERQMYGNDYGLSIMRLTDGRFVAINVDETLSPMSNGCEIVSWDGAAPAELLDINDNPIVYMPVMAASANEDFYKPLLIAGIGGDTVDVTYVDEEGNTVDITLSKIGFYCDRLEETVNIINRGVDDIGTLCWKEVDDTTCLFRIKQMAANLNSYGKDNYDDLTDSMREHMLAYKEEGYDTLIFDIRNNGGGDPYMIMAMASLVLPCGEEYYCSTSVFNEESWAFEKNADGSFVEGDRLVVEGEDLWNHGNIIVLVNAASISAADHFTALLDKCPNVTVMGFTGSNSSGQAVQGIHISDNEEFSLSTVPVLDEEGDIFIDTGTDGNSGVGIDHIIEFDENAVHALFDEDEDYVLDYALDYN